jgi:hypothetical protein
MCYIEFPAPRKFRCGHTILEPKEPTAVQCIAASQQRTWCPREDWQTTSKASSTSRYADCPKCREKKKPDPKRGDGDSGADGSGGSTQALQVDQAGIAVGAW